MTAAARSDDPVDAGGADARPRFTIGEVLAALRDEFPDVTISKIRYLEGEDLVHPQRTPSGYRKFSTADVDRLRFVLTAQRDHYLPLRVIKEQLDALDRGEQPTRPEPPAAAPSAPATPAEPAPRPAEDATLPAAAFAAAAGLDDAQLADCVQHGLLAPAADGTFASRALPVAQAVAGLAQHGIEPRHLRVHRTGAEREAALLEQVVAPALASRAEDARARAAEQLHELGGLSAQLHTALLELRLREVLGPDAGA
ncbi:transcriptional regulator FtsR [Klenkia taihuensis]|uniref:MerR family regulatory protein n=1 Tax=Klenkia taihuensis TaxID=1225127 RepID=A0A1I1R4Y9_9ACTN|nr:MerR family transcriptional regulator [Klenkia taihuensis]GHE07243.1 MerR family transcriptional regulator [Klenkia taihuensis]SFD29369.1 MerR family regulatory protein [Klenkia taihuensis]